MNFNPYEQGGIMGPRQKGLIEQLQGGTAAGPAIGTQAPPMQAPSAAPGIFQSDNASVSGYLQDAARAFAPKVHGIADEAGRKSAVQDYLNSLAPEVQKRGGSISDIKGEKARVNGRLIDFYRDIEGAADPQYLDVTDQGAAPAMSGGGAPGVGGIPLNAMLSGDPLASIQQALSSYQQPGMLQQLIEALSGGGMSNRV